MLTFIRERAQGWLAWVIVGLLIIPFALWGINEYFGTGGGVNMATVNGSDISQREFQQAYFEQRNRMQQMLGEQYDSRLFDAQIRENVISELINRELIRQYAVDNGYRISESLVVNTIRSQEAFQESGVFSTNLYEQQVRAQGQSPAAFEQRVQRTMLVSQVPEALVNTAIVTDLEVDMAIRLQEQKRDIQYLVLPVSNYRDESAADDSAIQAFYDNNPQRFLTEEQVRVEYVELAANQLTPDETPDEATLREFYESRVSEYRVPEERQARHILIQVVEDADEATVAAARAKADDVLAKIRAGESFEDLAKTHSDDIGSAQAGGDLGFFNRGVMDPAFEDAAFALKKGDVSDLVRTSFGFHILKLDAIRESKGKSFEDVRAELLAEYQQDIAERKYFELAEELTNLAYETPDSLREVADQVELELKQSTLFGRSGGPGVLAHPRVVMAAFSADVLQQGYNSEPVEIAKNHVVVLRLLEHREASQQALETVREQVKTQLLTEAARDAAAEAGRAALAQLQAGESSATLAQSLSVAWQQTTGLGRDSRDVQPILANEAFRLTRPPVDGTTYGSVVLANGDFALIQLTAVSDGDPANVDKASRETLKRRLAGEYGSNAERQLLESLKADANVVLNTTDL